MMNFTTLISPLLSLASAMNPSNLNQGKLSASALAALDRSLGTIASLGLTLGLYRVLVKLRDEYAETAASNNGHGHSSRQHQRNEMSSSVVEQGSDIIVSMRSLVHVFIRSVMMGMGIKRVKETMQQHMQEQNNTMKHPNHQWRHENPVRTYHGSCHCKSISFILRAPSHIEAKDCKGKIKYPHCISNAHDFHITNGNDFLSVYYVDLAPTKTSNRSRNPYYNRYEPKQNVIAAHTFCSRCGVHILRAPSSNSTKLEVNVNCLDDFNSNKHASEEFISINVTVDETKDGMGLGEGRPVFFDERKQPPRSNRSVATKETCYEDYQSVSSFNTFNNPYEINSQADSLSYQRLQNINRAEVQQPWPVESSTFKNDYERNGSINWKNIDGMSQASTPATLTSTLVTNSCEDSSTVPSYDENDISSPLNNGYSTQHSEKVTISGWPSATNPLPPITPRNEDRMTSSSSSAYGQDSNSNSRPSSMMKDQLKYYMRKHMTPPSRETARRKTKNN